MTHCGNSPRLYQNMLLFLAPDKPRLHELEEATRYHLAWMSIANDGALDLTQSQTQQVKAWQKELRETVSARIRETWVWLLVPGQADPRGLVEWLPTRLQGPEAIMPRPNRQLPVRRREPRRNPVVTIGVGEARAFPYPYGYYRPDY